MLLCVPWVIKVNIQVGHSSTMGTSLSHIPLTLLWLLGKIDEKGKPLFEGKLVLYIRTAVREPGSQNTWWFVFPGGRKVPSWWKLDWVTIQRSPKRRV